MYLVYSIMVAVSRLKDLLGGWRKRAQEPIKDSLPDTKDRVFQIMNSWEGAKSGDYLPQY